MRRLDLRTRLGRFWHEYTRMRTAIWFLIALIGIVLVGSFVPQQDTSAQQKVDDFLSAHHNLNTMASALGFPLTQVFISPLFFVLLGSLYVSLTACVLRRGRALVMRTILRHPRTPQYWGEWGSWLFHASFFLLLIAAVWGKATGYQGLVALTEGQTFTDTRSGYDQLQEGLLFNGQHTGLSVRLDSFHAAYGANGAANDYDSHVTVFDGASQVEQKDIRVNDFLGYGGIAVYQQDYGWAPVIRVTNPAGQVVFDSAVQFFGEDKAVETGVLKVPDFGYTLPGASGAVQLGARMAVFPDARTTVKVNQDGSVAAGQTQYAPGGMEARNPVLQLQIYLGNLGLDGQAQDVNALDTAQMQPYFSDSHPVPLPLGQTMSLTLPGAVGAAPTSFSIAFEGMRQYSLFLVKQDNGVGLIYVSFGLVLTGLAAKLYLRPFLESRRRRRRVVLPPVRTSPASAPREAEDEVREPVGAGARGDP